MARKGRKTRWRKLPIPIGNNQGETSCAPHNVPNNLEPEHPSSPSPKEQVSRVTFNEDEYTKITTPRQDMLFKKGYLSKKRAQPQEQQFSYTSPEPSHSPSESVESEQYVGCDETAPYPPPFAYPTGYMDPNGLFYLNGGGYEVYDPYTNSVTVIVGPGSGYPSQPVLAAVPCHPVPLQPIEWFAPPPQHQPNNFKKRYSTDSQHWGSSQSCESPCSGQEIEAQDSLFYSQPQYIYPGYMFGAPLYNINGVSVQGAAPPPPQHQPQHPHPQHQHASSQHQPSQHLPQPADQPKRRKKRRKRRRPGMGDDGSESSCEEVAGSGVSSDAGQGSSCSKTTDSGIHTGADSPQPQSSPIPLHDTPPPEVSTEEEPSQPIISHAQCLDNTTHTDSSTEDETSQQPHDTSLQSLIMNTDNITISPPVNGVHDSESEEKEEEDIEQTPPTEEKETSSAPEIIDKEPLSEHEDAPEGISQILRDESDEWLNAKDNDSDNGDEPVVEEEIPKETLSISLECPCPIDTVLKDETIFLDYKEDIEECIAEETGYSEEGWGSAEETSVEERWAMAELGEEATVDKPITEAVTRWLESQGTKALVPQQLPVESEDEGIGEETSSPTGSKNVKGNPFLVRYPSTGIRVADKSSCESEACAWRTKCDPMVSVDRYYRLGAESPPLAPSFKTATAHPTFMHIDPSVPFPCGLVCCILQ